MDHQPGSSKPGREPLVSTEMIRKAIQEWKQRNRQGNKMVTADKEDQPHPASWLESPVDPEPHLKRFLHNEILRICDETALTGAYPAVVRDLRNHFRRLIELTVTLLRCGYGQLLADFMPGEDGKVRNNQATGASKETPSNTN